MKRLFALLSLCLASLASATPTESEAAKAVVTEKLLTKLSAREEKHSKFSRAYLPPQVRRVRIPDERPTVDGQGGVFLSYAVDAHHGYDEARPADDSKDWRKDVIVGCVYPQSGEVFVKRGGKVFGAGLLLGKKGESAAPAHACQSVEPQLAAK